MSRCIRVGYVCRAGGGVGLGHVSRGRALLSAAGGGELILSQGIEEVLPLLDASERAVRLDHRGCDYDVLVIDDYGFTETDIEKLGRTRPVVIVDDWVRPDARCDLLVNPNVGAVAGDYARAVTRQALLGPAFALMRDDVRARRGAWRGDGRQVLVTFGGSDPGGHTGTVLRRLTTAFAGGPSSRPSIVGIVGPSAKGDFQPYPGIELVRNPTDFLDRCLGSLLVVCSASTTSHEMAAMGVPFVPLATNEHQERILTGWRNLGYSSGATVQQEGWLETLFDEIVVAASDTKEPRRRADLGTTIVDCEGPARVVDVMRGLLKS